MIAYFAAIPVTLYPTLCHKMAINKDKEAVLFVNENAFKSIGLLYAFEEFKNSGIFKDTVVCPMGIKFPKDMSIDEAEGKVADNYDNIFRLTGYDIYSFDEIYTMNDGWDGEQNVYFNMKHISYTWIQTSSNHIPKPAKVLKGECYVRLLNKYQALTPYAEYANACLLDTSEGTIKQFKEKNKDFKLWNRNQCFNSISDDDMNLLFKAFHLAEFKIDFVNTSEATLVIKNSFSYLNMYVGIARPLLHFESYDRAEIFSVMDKISIDFYATYNRKLFLKPHIGQSFSEAEIKRLYGNTTVSLPNVPFEILGRFFNSNNIKFDKIIGTTSTSLDAISPENYNRFYPLGIDFAKTWWFYISMYVSLVFAKEQNFRQIFCSDILKTQLELLSEEVGYDAEISTFNIKELNKIKTSLIICDLSGMGDFPFGKVDKTTTVIFLNTELKKDIFTEAPEMYAPVCIRKDRIADIECDILYRDEILWVYSQNMRIRKAARDFVFERVLKNLGMKVYSERITLPDAIKLFHEKFGNENEKLQEVIKRQDKQIKLLTEYISDPDMIGGRLRSTDDIYIYLDILRLIQKKYLIAVAVRDTPGNCISQDIMDRLFELGFTKLSKELWRMYIGVSIKSAIVFNRTGERRESPVEYMYESDNMNLNIASKAWRHGDQAAIIINDTDYAVNMRGLNIVVYDVENSCLIDSVAFDSHTESWRFKRK